MAIVFCYSFDTEKPLYYSSFGLIESITLQFLKKSPPNNFLLTN
jgi:hypothetical protein